MLEYPRRDVLRLDYKGLEPSFSDVKSDLSFFTNNVICTCEYYKRTSHVLYLLDLSCMRNFVCIVSSQKYSRPNVAIGVEVLLNFVLIADNFARSRC